jgi:hypothetical protein
MFHLRNLLAVVYFRLPEALAVSSNDLRSDK